MYVVECVHNKVITSCYAYYMFCTCEYVQLLTVQCTRDLSNDNLITKIYDTLPSIRSIHRNIIIYYPI